MNEQWTGIHGVERAVGQLGIEDTLTEQGRDEYEAWLESTGQTTPEEQAEYERWLKKQHEVAVVELEQLREDVDTICENGRPVELAAR